MKCSICDVEIESCDHCGNFFEEEEVIICVEFSHVCELCLDDWLKENSNYEKAKVLSD